MSKRTANGNKVGASLYVGVGGIGGKIIRRVAALGKHDDLSKARFVIMDTDVNDLSRAEGEINITPIQTSSPRTIRDYLLQDADAREEWFPNNMIINSKTVSEGAGQVRAISRLALNATIRTGRINALYRAIDELYDKDGSDKKQTIKVVVASTVAGGTGSGIAMIVAMLIRNYLAENYPDSSAIIRGFMLMPGVMDTINPSTSERLSLARNGYATIKEINAFMMRPFFESVPELRRYLGLSVEVPNAVGGVDKLSCSPFDFCFLFDRTDGNVCNMSNLGQYMDYAAHSIYELCIGPMSAKASSKEDNIHKEFLDDKKLSRNRFCGAGASVVRYPYEEIRDYVAYEWMEKQLIGYTSDQLSERDSKNALLAGWLFYDSKYSEKLAEYESNSAGKQPPVRGEEYISALRSGGSDDLSVKLNDLIARKTMKYDYDTDTSINEDGVIDEGSNVDPAVRFFINAMAKKAREIYTSQYEDIVDNYEANRDTSAKKKTLESRYFAINRLASIISPEAIEKVVKGFVDSVFNGKTKMGDGTYPAYSLEDFLSLNGAPLHPNVMRYYLYLLSDAIETTLETLTQPSYEDYKDAFDIYRLGKKKSSGERDTKPFQVPGNGAEQNLLDMCVSCKERGTDANVSSCNKLINNLASTIDEKFNECLCYYICQEAKQFVEHLIAKFENFYDQFERKVGGLAKLKKGILGSLEFRNGDCVYNLFSEPGLLLKLAKEQRMPQNGSQNDNDLFMGIYNGIKTNAQKARRIRNNPFSDETEDDIFDSIMIDIFRKMVDSSSSLDMDIVRACALEHQVICLCKADKTPNDEEKAELIEMSADIKLKNAHMHARIKKGRELACPSIIRKDFEEERAVDAMAYNKYMEDGEGMRLDGEHFSADYASDTVEKYEFRFYRSIYNITPTQLQKLCSPQADPGQLGECIDFGESVPGMVGTYFTAYQDYMRRIGPDNRLNPVITPHIDKRWNSITVLPELDPREYQHVLMKRIHKAMVYGFIFKIIEKRMTSKYDMEKLVYEYIDGRNGPRKFIVSNHTKCDRLFEVLDSLYFDRYAVYSIHETVDRKRKKEFESSTVYEDTTFARYLTKIERSILIDSKERRILADEKLADSPVSLFEIPILYWNSLPRKDESELSIMVDAIFEILETEIGTFVNKDDFAPLIAKSIIDSYNLMYKNFVACPSIYLGVSTYVNVTKAEEIAKNDEAIKVIRKKVLEKIDGLDVSRSDEFSLCDKSEMDELFV